MWVSVVLFYEENCGSKVYRLLRLLLDGSHLLRVLIILMNSKNNHGVISLILAVLAKFYESVSHLFRLDNKSFALAVFSKLSMRVLNFVAMVLPVKILLFLAPGQNIPTILSPWFDSKEQLVFVLCFLTVVTFIFANVFEKIVELAVKKKVYKIVANGDGLKQKQTNKIRQIVNKCIAAVAAGVFFVILIIIVSLIYPELIVVFWIGFALLCVVCHFIMKRPDLKYLMNKPYKLFNMGFNICFFGVFFYMVFDSLVLGVEHSFIIMIISLILMRQGSTALSQFSLSLVDIYKQREINLG